MGWPDRRRRAPRAGHRSRRAARSVYHRGPALGQPGVCGAEGSGRQPLVRDGRRLGPVSREQDDCLLGARRPGSGSENRADFHAGRERVAGQLCRGQGAPLPGWSVRQLDARVLQPIRLEPDPGPVRESSRSGLGRRKLQVGAGESREVLVPRRPRRERSIIRRGGRRGQGRRPVGDIDEPRRDQTNPAAARRQVDGATRANGSPAVPVPGAAWGRSGRMWLGFENGEVVVFEGDASRLYSAKDGLQSGRVLVIAEDREGHVWIGGESGLSRFGQDRFVTLTQDNGLPGSSVSGIVEDDDGNLWLAGALGILRVKPQELDKALASASYRVEGVTFDATDGLRGLPRQREPFPTATRAADGRLWFATTGGVAVIDPRRWLRNAMEPPVKIERVNADDRNLESFSGVRLPPNTKNLELQYAALSLTAPERVRFRYKLEGYDADWRGPVSARSATYTNLPPRDYRFRVIACNNDGVWNEEGAALEFTIVPAFHQTRAFLLLCAAAAGFLAWAGYRWRIRQVRSRLQLQFRERLAERTRIAQELHDTLLQGFLSASMQLHVAVNHVPAETADKRRLNRVLELMRSVIEEGRNAVKGLRSSPGSHDDLEEAFSRVREELDAKEDIDFFVIGEGQARPLHAIIRDEVYRIGREALVNAFQHSGATRIEVEVEFAPKGLRVTMRDDGRGIDPQLLESGREGHWGLAGMRERAKNIGARLKVWSRALGGTEVELSVPSSIAFRAQFHSWPWGWLARLYPGRAGDLHGRKRAG